MRIREFLQKFPLFHERGNLFIYPEGINVELLRGGRGILSISLYNALVTGMQALIGETKIDLFRCKTANKWVLYWNPLEEETCPAPCWVLDFDPYEEVIFLIMDHNFTQKQWEWNCSCAFASEEEAKAALG